MTLRADAARNRKAIVEAARATFAEHGLDAPLDEIAKRAGIERWVRGGVGPRPWTGSVCGRGLGCGALLDAHVAPAPGEMLPTWMNVDMCPAHPAAPPRPCEQALGGAT